MSKIVPASTKVPVEGAAAWWYKASTANGLPPPGLPGPRERIQEVLDETALNGDRDEQQGLIVAAATKKSLLNAAAARARGHD